MKNVFGAAAGTGTGHGNEIYDGNILNKSVENICENDNVFKISSSNPSNAPAFIQAPVPAPAFIPAPVPAPAFISAPVPAPAFISAPLKDADDFERNVKYLNTPHNPEISAMPVQSTYPVLSQKASQAVPPPPPPPVFKVRPSNSLSNPTQQLLEQHQPPPPPPPPPPRPHHHHHHQKPEPPAHLTTSRHLPSQHPKHSYAIIPQVPFQLLDKP